MFYWEENLINMLVQAPFKAATLKNAMVSS